MNSLPPGFQLKILSQFLTAEHVEMHGRKAVFQGWIEPHPICDRYLIDLRYHFGRFPEIAVLEPRLKCRSDRKCIPHMWDQKHLCLHDPTTHTLDLAQGFNRTIIPWTALWLYHYEHWFTTGVWQGGGVHPQPRRKRSKRMIKTGG